jgi:hypothetical protein
MAIIFSSYCTHFIGISLALYNQHQQKVRNMPYQPITIILPGHPEIWHYLGTRSYWLLSLIHMGDFWLKMKLGQLPMVTYPGVEGEIKDLYFRVNEAFKQPLFGRLLYVIGMIMLAFHSTTRIPKSAFQTLGLNHKKYTPRYQNHRCRLMLFLVPLGFAIIPIYGIF